MIEFLAALTLFGSVWYFWISVVILFVLFFVSEADENGFLALGSLIAVTILYYFWGDIKTILPLFSFINISIYLLLGLTFSTLRTFFAGRELGKRIKNLPEKDNGGMYSANQEYQKKEFIDKLKGNVFRWWFMWPISLISWLVTDLVKEIWDYVYSKLSGFYNYIVELGIKSSGLK